jgi:hypothetical protein
MAGEGVMKSKGEKLMSEKNSGRTRAEASAARNKGSFPVSVAFDVGSSVTKMQVAGEEPVTELTVVERVATVTPDIRSKVIIVENEPFLAGEIAYLNIRNRPEGPNRAAHFHGGKEQYALMCAVLNDQGLYDGPGGTLSISIPYNEVNNRKLLDELKNRTRFHWQVFGEDGALVDRSIDFERVSIVPQGVGALIHHNLKDNDLYKSLGIIEIGSVTTDAIVLGWSRKNGRHEYNAAASDSLRTISVDKFIEWFKEELQKIAGLSQRKFAYHYLSEVIETRSFRITHGASVFTDEVERAFLKAQKRFTEALIVEVIEQWGEELYMSHDLMLVSGGGAELIDRNSWEFKDRTIFGSSLDNVKGQANVI